MLRHPGEHLEDNAAVLDGNASDDPASDCQSADEAPDDDHHAWVRHVEACMDLAQEMEEAVAEQAFENPVRAFAPICN